MSVRNGLVSSGRDPQSRSGYDSANFEIVKNMIDASWREQLKSLFGNLSEHIDDDTVEQTGDLDKLVSCTLRRRFFYGKDIFHH